MSDDEKVQQPRQQSAAFTTYGQYLIVPSVTGTTHLCLFGRVFTLVSARDWV